MFKILFTWYLLLFTPVYLIGQSTWELLNPTPSYRTGVDIQFLSDEHGYIITDAFELLETNDGGENWQVKQSFTGYDFFEDFAFFNTLGFIVGDDGRVLKTQDAGENWTEINVGISQDLHTVNVLDSETIYIAGSSQLAKSLDGSASWTVLDLPNTFTKSVVFTSPLIGHAVCTDGAIFKTIDGGQNWYVADQNIDLTADFITIYFYNENLGFASLTNSELYKTMDAGENWELVPGIEELFYTFFFVDENTGYAGGKNGTLFKTIDGGGNWESVEFQDSRYDYTSIYGLYFLDANNGFTVGNRGRITKTNNGGETWSEYSPTYDNVLQIYFPSNEIGYSRIQQHELIKTTDAGSTWENIGRPFAGKKTGNIFFVSDNTGYVIAGGEHISDPKEFVYKTTDGGLTWAPTNNANPLEATIDLNALYFLDEQIGYASGNRFAANKRVFKTTDGGVTWSLVGEMRLTKMQFISETIGYGMGHLENTLYKTTDGGVNWEALFVADDYITDFDFVSPTNGYMVAADAYMYKTENAGADWQQVETAPIEYFDKVEFVTTDFGYLSTGDKIFKTEDGGNTWEFEVQVVEMWGIYTTDDRVYVCGTYGKILASEYLVVSQEDIAAQDHTSMIFPNPATDEVYFRSEQIDQVQLFDAMGRLIRAEKQPGQSFNISYELPGIYFLNIFSDQRIYSVRLVKH